VDKQQLNHLAAARILEYYFGIENGWRFVFLYKQTTFSLY
jgi:hypothetical protein